MHLVVLTAEARRKTRFFWCFLNFFFSFTNKNSLQTPADVTTLKSFNDKFQSPRLQIHFIVVIFVVLTLSSQTKLVLRPVKLSS